VEAVMSIDELEAENEKLRGWIHELEQTVKNLRKRVKDLEFDKWGGPRSLTPEKRLTKLCAPSPWVNGDTE
jgi:predicted nuclease with TOPRIM domain